MSAIVLEISRPDGFLELPPRVVKEMQNEAVYRAVAEYFISIAATAENLKELLLKNDGGHKDAMAEMYKEHRDDFNPRQKELLAILSEDMINALLRRFEYRLNDVSPERKTPYETQPVINSIIKKFDLAIPNHQHQQLKALGKQHKIQDALSHAERALEQQHPDYAMGMLEYALCVAKDCLLPNITNHPQRKMNDDDGVKLAGMLTEILPYAPEGRSLKSIARMFAVLGDADKNLLESRLLDGTPDDHSRRITFRFSAGMTSAFLQNAISLPRDGRSQGIRMARDYMQKTL